MTATTCEAGGCGAEMDRHARAAANRWATVAPRQVHYEAARAALAKDDADAGEADRLALAVHKWCCGPGGLVAALVRPTQGADLTDGVPVRRGMLALDADLADWWAPNVDAREADTIGNRARARWAQFTAGDLDVAGQFAPWANDGADRLAALARSLWRQLTAPDAARVKARVPALVHAVAADILHPAMAGQFKVCGDGKVRDCKGQDVGTVDPGADPAQVARGLDLLGDVCGHRLVKLLVVRPFAQTAANDPEPDRVAILGGWGGLADLLGCGNGRHNDLRALVAFGAAVQWRHPIVGELGRLWTADETAAAPGRGAEVVFAVGGAMLPGNASRLAKQAGNSMAARCAKFLVPELAHEPPIAGLPTRLRGRAWTVARLVVAVLAKGSMQLACGGAVALDWPALARTARLPARQLSAVRAAFLCGDGEAPPLLTEPHPGQFALADAHADARDCLADLGHTRLFRGHSGARAAAVRAGRRCGNGSLNRERQRNEVKPLRVAAVSKPAADANGSLIPRSRFPNTGVTVPQNETDNTSNATSCESRGLAERNGSVVRPAGPFACRHGSAWREWQPDNLQLVPAGVASVGLLAGTWLTDTAPHWVLPGWGAGRVKTWSQLVPSARLFATA